MSRPERRTSDLAIRGSPGWADRMRSGFNFLAASILCSCTCRSARSCCCHFSNLVARPGSHCVKPRVSFCFTLAAAAITLIFGILLAYGSGVMGATVTRHMWGGIALMIELLLCVVVRPAWTSGQLDRVYPVIAHHDFAHACMDSASGRFAHPRKRLPDSLHAESAATALSIGNRSF